MTNFSLLLLSVSIVAGQLIKIPIGASGATILDLTIGLLSLFGFFQIQFKLKKPPQEIMATGVFVLAAILSLILTPLRLSANEYLIGFLYTFRFGLYFLFAWVIYSEAFPNFRENITKTLIISGVLLALLGLLQLIFFPNLIYLQNFGWDPHYFRTVSTFLDPNFIGVYLVLTFLLLSSLRDRRAWQSVLLFVVYLALLTTFSRSSYLMFVTSGLVLAILKKSKKILFTTIVLFIILLIGFKIYTDTVAIPRNIDRGQSASFRISTWQQGWILFQNHPILGVGFNAYKYALNEYNLASSEFLKNHGATSNDSSLLYVASTTGVLGLLAYLFFLITLIKQSIRKNPILTSAILGLITQSFLANSLFYPPILIWVSLMILVPKK